MSEHIVSLAWEASGHVTQPNTYNRDHKADFGHDISLPVSAAAEYLGNAELPDPEQILVNALASCHMLYFLALCEASGYKVSRYVDRAIGIVEKSDAGHPWVSTIHLHPRVEFLGENVADPKTTTRLHERAHKGCFIANSIKSKVIVHSPQDTQ